MTAADNLHAYGEKDKRPLDRRIAADLRSRILNKALPPGSQLPRVSELIETYGVANQTVQRALRLLKDEGLVIGKAGKGVYVRDRSLQTITPSGYIKPDTSGGPYPWAAEASKRGQQGSSRLLEVAEVVPEPDVAELLRLPAEQPAVVRRQILMIDERPAELASNYYPLEIARGTALLAARRIRGGAPALLAELGHHPRRVEDFVSTTIPTTQEFAELELPEDVPVLRTLRVVYTDGMRPMEVSVLVKSGSLYRLNYSWDVEQPEPPC